MPIKSIFNQKWIFKIRPVQTEININKDFFKKDKSYKKRTSLNKSKFTYDLIFNLPKGTNLKVNNSIFDTKIRGNVIYKSSKRQIIANLNSNFEGKGHLKLNFNRNLNKDLFWIKVFSRGIDLKASDFKIGNRIISVEKGKFKSNFKFFKSSNKTFCEGRFVLTKLNIKPDNFSENINSNLTSFICKDNSLIGNSKNLNYGTLTSNFDLNIPLNKNINNIDFKGSIGYVNSLNPDIKLAGTIPYWFDKRGINFGNFGSSFDINRTQLSNLNIFRKTI